MDVPPAELAIAFTAIPLTLITLSVSVVFVRRENVLGMLVVLVSTQTCSWSNSLTLLYKILICAASPFLTSSTLYLQDCASVPGAVRLILSTNKKKFDLFRHHHNKSQRSYNLRRSQVYKKFQSRLETTHYRPQSGAKSV